MNTDNRAHLRLRLGALAVAAVVTLAFGLVTYALGAWNGLEAQSVYARFQARPTVHPSGIVIVGIDDPTMHELQLKWPFPRALDARLIDELHADGARTIVFDADFSLPTDARDDDALYESIARAGGAILATVSSDGHGHTTVLGGDANLAAIDARAARANLVSDGDVFRAYDYSIDSIPTIGVATAERVLGRPLTPAQFGPSPAWIDFPGPPGTFPSVSYGDVLAGRVPATTFAGKIVIVGATSPLLQDVHATPTTTGQLMAGVEIQAATIYSALHGNPLRDAPPWAAWLAIIVAALLSPLLAWRLRIRYAVPVSLAAALGYAVGCVGAFDHGVILVATYPVITWGVGLVATVIAAALAGDIERHLIAVYARVLEHTVRERDRQLSATELEIVHRLAHAAESRDTDTGEHIERIGFLCEQLGLAAGMSRAESKMLGHASIMHDVGKIGVPDAVLLKPARLDAVEWEIMRMHTTTGGEILGGSERPIIQMAETIARTHHEHWDGGGYPAGLTGNEIPLVGRICAICDVFDALVSPRPYKAAWSVDEALSEVRRSSGSHFDPGLVDVFLSLIPSLLHLYAEQSPAALADAGDPPPEGGEPSGEPTAPAPALSLVPDPPAGSELDSASASG